MSVSVYALMRGCRDFGFKDQLCRSGVSIASNIAEGSERLHRKEKRQFFAIAKGSAGELKTQIIIGERVGYIQPSLSTKLKQECEEISNILGTLISKI